MVIHRIGFLIDVNHDGIADAVIFEDITELLRLRDAGPRTGPLSNTGGIGLLRDRNGDGRPDTLILDPSGLAIRPNTPLAMEPAMPALAINPVGRGHEPAIPPGGANPPASLLRTPTGLEFALVPALVLGSSADRVATGPSTALPVVTNPGPADVLPPVVGDAVPLGAHEALQQPLPPLPPTPPTFEFTQPGAAPEGSGEVLEGWWEPHAAVTDSPAADEPEPQLPAPTDAGSAPVTGPRAPVALCLVGLGLASPAPVGNGRARAGRQPRAVS
jgi:hypothetical protein